MQLIPNSSANRQHTTHIIIMMYDGYMSHMMMITSTTTSVWLVLETNEGFERR